MCNGVTQSPKIASKMSDEFSQCCSRFKDAIRFTQPELRYEAREKEEKKGSAT